MKKAIICGILIEGVGGAIAYFFTLELLEKLKVKIQEKKQENDDIIEATVVE